MQNIIIVGPSSIVPGGIAKFNNGLKLALEDSDINAEVTLVKTNSIGKWSNLIAGLKAIVQCFLHSLKVANLFYVSMGSGKSMFRKFGVILFPMLLGRKVILHMHGGLFTTRLKSYGKLRIKVIRYFFKRATKVIFLNSEDLQAAKHCLCLDGKHFQVLYNFIDYENSKPVRKENVIIYIGKICKSKGIDKLIAAYELGVGGYSLELYGPIGNIDKGTIDGYYGGTLTENKKWDMLTKSTAFVLPSLFEGFPLTVIEASRVNCLVFYSGVGSVDEVFEPSVDYVKISNSNVESINRVLNYYLIDNRDLAENIRNAGREKSSTLTSENFIDIIRNIVR